MKQVFLPVLLIASATLFGFGIAKSVLSGTIAFHTISDVLPVSGHIGAIWLWPLACLGTAFILAIFTGDKQAQQREEGSHL